MFNYEMTDFIAFFDFLAELGDVDWKSCARRNVIPDDAGKYQLPVPWVCFRFRKENVSYTELLKDAVISYNGAVKWTMISRKKEHAAGLTHCILPLRMAVLSDYSSLKIASERIKSDEPDFVVQAYDDFDILVEYIRSVFRAQKNGYPG